MCDVRVAFASPKREGGREGAGLEKKRKACEMQADRHSQTEDGRACVCAHTHAGDVFFSRTHTHVRMTSGAQK